jgi:hypothetical protein
MKTAAPLEEVSPEDLPDKAAVVYILTSDVGADNNNVIGGRDTKTGIKAQGRIRDTGCII